jgi:hypothetical protein
MARRSKDSRTRATREAALPSVNGSAWAALWRSENKLDGVSSHLIYHNGKLAVFNSRRLAREHIEREYGYIRTRPDLKAEPHGWKMPIVVKVIVTLNAEVSDSRRPKP